MGDDGIRVHHLIGIKVVQLNELCAVYRQLQVKNVIAGGVEGDAARFRIVQVGVDAQLHLFVEHQHFGLILCDVSLQFAADFAGEVAHHLVHQLAHHIADFIRRMGAGQIAFRHAHVEQVAAIKLHGRSG